MNIFLLLVLVSAFGYLACNLGADKRPGHSSYRLKPVIAIVVVVVIGLLIWPVVGPALLPVFSSLGIK